MPDKNPYPKPLPPLGFKTLKSRLTLPSSPFPMSKECLVSWGLPHTCVCHLTRGFHSYASRPISDTDGDSSPPAACLSPCFLSWYHSLISRRISCQNTTVTLSHSCLENFFSDETKLIAKAKTDKNNSCSVISITEKSGGGLA